MKTYTIFKTLISLVGHKLETTDLIVIPKALTENNNCTNKYIHYIYFFKFVILQYKFQKIL